MLAAIRHDYGLDRPAARPVRALGRPRRAAATSAPTSASCRSATRSSPGCRSRSSSRSSPCLFGSVIGIGAGIIAAARRGKASDYAATLGRARRALGAALLARPAADHPLRGPAALAARRAATSPSSRTRSTTCATCCCRRSCSGPAWLRCSCGRCARRCSTRSAPTTCAPRARRALRECSVVGSHALRNSLITVTTILGLQLGALISGAVVTEQIFGIAGLRPADRSTPSAQRDYAMLQGVVLVVAVGLRRRQPARRRHLLVAQPADPGGGNVAIELRRSHDRSDALLATRRSAPAPASARSRGGRSRRGLLSSPSAFVARRAASRPGSRRTRPDHTDFDGDARAAPRCEHLLGTDELGRDIVLADHLGGPGLDPSPACSRPCSRWSSRVPIGLIAGYYRGWIDSVIARVTDVLLAFPFLILAVGLAAILGPSLMNATMAIGHRSDARR